MATIKIAITMDEDTLREVDAIVARGEFPSRSRAIQDSVAEALEKITRSRLAAQCALLDQGEEQAMAEEFSPEELERWLEC